MKWPLFTKIYDTIILISFLRKTAPNIRKVNLLLPYLGNMYRRGGITPNIANWSNILAQ
jgi:hypothetical protein